MNNSLRLITTKLTLNRIINELPLLLVLIILLWSQYTISISLAINYLILTRKRFLFALSLSLPFNLFWLSTLINLLQCVITGPGWVQKYPSTNHPHHHDDLENQHPAIPLNSYHDHHAHDPHELSDLEEDELDVPSSSSSSSDPHSSSVPLLQLAQNLSQSPSRHQDALTTTTTRNHLLPRPAYTSTLPPSYMAGQTTLPPSNLSFQEQVQRQQQSPPSDLLNALNFPPSASRHTNPLPPPSARRVDSLMCKSDGSLRFCRKCELYKADRSHHCSSCGRCVLRMDHHCPWLGGRCVGLKNHKFFILFLISASLTSFIAALAATKGLMDFVSNTRISPADPFQLAPLNWAFLLLVGGLFGLVLTGFTFYHLYLISVNRTTIENMERSVRIRPTGTSDPSESYALLRTTRLRTFEGGGSGLEGPNRGGRLMGPDSQISPGGEEGGGGGVAQILDDEGGREEEGETSRTAKLPSYNLPIYKSDDQLSRLERRKLEAGATQLNLFDLGSTRANFKQVFGVHSPLWQWALPLHPKGISDGYQYPINHRNLQKLMQLTSEIRLLPNERSNELRFERP